MECVTGCDNGGYHVDRECFKLLKEDFKFPKSKSSRFFEIMTLNLSLDSNSWLHCWYVISGIKTTVLVLKLNHAEHDVR